VVEFDRWLCVQAIDEVFEVLAAVLGLDRALAGPAQPFGEIGDLPDEPVVFGPCARTVVVPGGPQPSQVGVEFGTLFPLRYRETVSMCGCNRTNRLIGRCAEPFTAQVRNSVSTARSVSGWLSTPWSSPSIVR